MGLELRCAPGEDPPVLDEPRGQLRLAADLGARHVRSWISWEYEAPWHPAAPPMSPLLGPGAELLRQLA